MPPAPPVPPPAPDLLEFDADFSGPELDPAQWIPHYLPQWSGRELTQAEGRTGAAVLRLGAAHLSQRREDDDQQRQRD